MHFALHAVDFWTMPSAEAEARYAIASGFSPASVSHDVIVRYAISAPIASRVPRAPSSMIRYAYSAVIASRDRRAPLASRRRTCTDKSNYASAAYKRRSMQCLQVWCTAAAIIMERKFEQWALPGKVRRSQHVQCLLVWSDDTAFNEH